MKILQLIVIFAATSLWVSAALYWGYYFAQKAWER